MAETIVTEITDAAKVLISAELGAEYFQLDYEHDLESNANFSSKPKRFGFISLGAEFSTGDKLLKTVTLDHDFQLVLSTDFNNSDDDVKQTTAKNLLFEKTNDLMKVIINKKLGLPGKVFLVTGISIESPEFLNDNQICVVRTNLNVQYRYRTTPL